MAGAAGGFVTRSFESMLKECSGKKYGALQKAIHAYLDCMNEGNRKPGALDSASTNTGAESDVKAAETIIPLTIILASAGNTLEGAQAELVLQPLRLAFETKNMKLVEASLDCLHKLIAYDHLEGDPGLDGGKNAPLFADMLTMICVCVDSSSLDSTVLQVLKVLLTVVASTKFRVHGEPLLGIINVCYNISLNSKSPVNQATSKAMLTQMISIIFRRMDSDQIAPSSVNTDQHMNHASSCTDGINEKIVMDGQSEKRPASDDNMNQRKEGSPTSVEILQNLAGSADIKGLEAILNKVISTQDGETVSRGVDLESVSMGQRDALLVFHTLCKMSAKDENDDATMKTRLLSLELLQSLLEGMGYSLTKTSNFIDSLKAYLCYSLLRASVSPSLAVFQYATGIFAALLLRFRESLKGEIGIFFPLIILRSIDVSDTATSQKASVLRMLEKLCKYPEMLADVYANYDCDLEAPNLFERMVNSLSRIAQGSHNVEPNSVAAAQISSIRTSSLQCLVNVIKSLVDWEKSERQSGEHSRIGQSYEEKVKQSMTVDVNGSVNGGLNQFEKAIPQSSTVEAAVLEFNRNPGKGVEFLVSNKLIEKTAASVVQFLRNTPGLDKAVVGEYLGQPEEFPVAVMHAYVDSMKFSGSKFDVAFREFLQGFQLPEEAHKIDRIMEKFAERYYAENPELFRSADAAYVLSYSVIMLNIDAHDHSVWPKMSKSDFIQMNSMSDGEECAPKILLEEIYDSIVKEEIELRSDASDSAGQRPATEKGRLIHILNLALPRRKSDSDTKIKSEQIVKQMQSLLRKQRAKRGAFYGALQIELVRPMLEAVGWPLLAAFSVIMEEGDDKGRILLCMEGLKAGIHVTWILGMDTMRFAFLTSLVRFTFLHSPKEMRGKNVEALRTLVALGETEMDTLQNTWNAVLECISRLEYITSTPAVAVTMMHGSNQISKDSVLQSLKELAGRPIEQVFVNTVKLPSDSIVEFFAALCCVSAEELKQNPARMFSLQKLVEISYYNMPRIRLVWARIWAVLGHHFVAAGSHHDDKIALYAIDSLRQLGMKYLERAELSNFTFQSDILKPFVLLMRNSQNQIIRGLVLDCIVQMIKSKVGSIKSGWKSVFMIFTEAAADDLESKNENAFENVEQVILEHFDQVVGGCFMDCVNCLIRFAKNKSSTGISLKAIALLRLCEDRLAEGFIPGGALKSIGTGSGGNQNVTEQYLFPMLAGVSDLTFDSRLEVRNCALEMLFDLLNERGSKFSANFWTNIFQRVLFPIFDQVRHAGKEGDVSSGDECLRDTIIHSLQLLCNLFNTFYKEISFMLPPLLNLLVDCAKKTDQSVVSISLGALVHLIKVGGHNFSDGDWDTLLKSIRDASYATQPLELLNSLESGGSKDLFMQEEDRYMHKSDKSVLTDPLTDTIGIGKTVNQSPLNYGTESIGKCVDEHKHDNSNNESEGKGVKAPESESLRKSQTFGVRIMGNMMDSILLRSLTSKSKIQTDDVSMPSSPLIVHDAVEHTSMDEDKTNPLLETVRVKCVTQLLLLGALDCIQRKYWSRLKFPQKLAIMDILLSLLEFAASYNSSSNLRERILQTPSDRPPLNLMRQEMEGTSLYLDILQKSTIEDFSDEADHVKVDRTNINPNSDPSTDENLAADKPLKDIAEGKLVAFCEQILKEASDLQHRTLEAEAIHVHRILELRAPIIVKVLKGMSLMNNHMFKKHLREFYPLITKLICCEQMDVRGALGDLFSMQLTSLLS